MNEFELKVHECQGVPVIGVQGDLDLYTAPRLKSTANALINRGHRHLILDLGETTFLDSSGVAALIAVKKHFLNGDLRVVAGRDPARRLLQRLSLQNYLGAHDSTEEALQNLQQAG